MIEALDAPPLPKLGHLTIHLEAASGYSAESTHANVTPEQYAEVMGILHNGVTKRELVAYRYWKGKFNCYDFVEAADHFSRPADGYDALYL